MTNRCIHDVVAGSPGLTDDRVAVRAPDGTLTYRRLDTVANAVAHELHARGLGPGDCVGVLMPRTTLLVAALLGVSKAGAVAVPLGVDHPPARLRAIREDAALHALLVLSTQAARADLDVAAIAVDVLEPRAPAPRCPAGASDAAYVIYTSGSTGRPKGVVIEHASAVNLIEWGTRTWSPDELAVNLAAAPITFDFSITEIYPTLAAGGTVLLLDSLLDLPSAAGAQDVTMVSGTPTALRLVAERGLPPAVRTVNSGGEPLTGDLVATLFASPGLERVRNLYGPSECTTLSHAHDIARADLPHVGVPSDPPLGVAVAGAHALVLDDDATPTAEGEPGQLWIAGPGVARGYLDRPELTRRRFVADPQVPGGRRYATGDLVRREGGVDHFVGRMDDQVKVRGFRIELGEVAAALRSHPSVVDAVASVAPGPAGTPLLTAHVVLAAGHALDPAALQEHARSTSPEYAVPSLVGAVAEVPVSASSGKVDRAALPAIAPPGAPRPLDPPRPGMETLVAAAMAEVLGVPLGREDSFYAAGGDSIAAARTVATIGERTGFAVPLAAFVQSPTPAGMARYLDETGPTGTKAPEATGAVEAPLLPVQTFMWITPVMWPGSSNTAGITLRLRGPVEPGHVQTALDAIVHRHEVFRTVVEVRGETPVAVVRDAVAVPVEVVDLRDSGPDDQRVRIRELTGRLAARRFDLSRSVPLVETVLARTADSEATLVVTLDHYCFDGYSVGIFMRELLAGLGAARRGEPDPTPRPALQVGDLAAWEAAHPLPEAERAASRQFWSQELAGLASPNLPGELRTRGPAVARRLVRAYPPATREAVAAALASSGLSVFALSAAVLGTQMLRRTGLPALALGVVTAFRDRPGTGDVIGPLDGMVPLRVDRPEPGTSIGEVARRLQVRARAALAHQELGIEEISTLVTPERHPGDPLLPVFLSMQPPQCPLSLSEDGTTLELLGELDGGGIFSDLAYLVNETVDGPEIQLNYDTERFAEPAVADLLAEYLDLLARVAADLRADASALVAADGSAGR